MTEPYKYNAAMLIDDADLDNFVSETTLSVFRFSKIIYIKKDVASALKFLTDIKETEGIPFPDAIFVDINMPETDGFQFLKSFEKTTENKINKPKMVMLTSSIFQHDLKRAKEVWEGITYIVKPLTEESLKLI